MVRWPVSTARTASTRPISVGSEFAYLNAESRAITLPIAGTADNAWMSLSAIASPRCFILLLPPSTENGSTARASMAWQVLEGLRIPMKR